MRKIKLKEVRISNYRSIRDEQILITNNDTTLIGPNNSGKTNALRAIQILFGGYENTHGYNRATDIPFDRQSNKTSIIGHFEIDESEKWFWAPLERLHEMQGTKREGNLISLYLYFTETNTPVYNFFTNTKRPQDKKADYSRILRNLVSEFIEKFEIIYIPSEKSIDELYRNLLAPRVSQKAAAILGDAIPNLKAELGKISQSIKTTLVNSNIDGIDIDIEIPDDNFGKIIGEFSLAVTDEVKTTYLSKGRGIQAAIFYASLHWIDERIKESKQNPIWLIEEPESYMHPELASTSRDMIHQLAKRSNAIISTHSLQFMPRTTDGIHGFSIQDGSTRIDRFVKFEDACNSLKRSLGIRFSDYYGLSDNNVLVEGKWDLFIIKECITKIEELTNNEYKLLKSAMIQEKEGTTSLCGFIKATYQHIRKEVAAVTVIDGDQAGLKIRRELQGYFSGREEFSANLDYVSVRSNYPIEGIFPDEWIIECHQEHPGWFENWSLDAAGTVEPYDIKDRNKENYAKYMCGKLADVKKGSEIIPHLENRTFPLFDSIESALVKQNKRLEESVKSRRKTSINSAQTDETKRVRKTTSTKRKLKNQTHQ